MESKLRFKTTVGVYSLRAKNDIPYVSAPVTWEELEALRRKSDPKALPFDPETLVKRVEKVGDLFAPLLTLKQSLHGPMKKPKAPQKERSTASVPPTKEAPRPTQSAEAVPKFVNRCFF